MIKKIDLDREKLVEEVVKKALAVEASLQEFKADAFGAISKFLERSDREYGYKPRGKSGAANKGNITLFSFDGKHKVVRSVADTISFGEQLQTAKLLIDECIHDWTADSSSEIRVLINDAFQVDKAGNISVGRVLGLRKLNINDKRWKQAMEAIADAMRVVGSTAYLRVYRRVGESGSKYEPVALDLAAV
jgi:hypothetical protein